MDSFQKFYDRTLRFLSFRPRSEKEVRDYLLRHSGKQVKRAHPESEEDSGQARMTTTNQVINKLKEQNFINDEEFARWWIEQRTGSKPKGFRLIKLELQHKGIDRETIEKIIGYYDIKILGNEGARRLIEKQYPKYTRLSNEEIRQKLGQFLLRRGFDWEMVKQAIDEVMKKE